MPWIKNTPRWTVNIQWTHNLTPEFATKQTLKIYIPPALQEEKKLGVSPNLLLIEPDKRIVEKQYKIERKRGTWPECNPPSLNSAIEKQYRRYSRIPRYFNEIAINRFSCRFLSLFFKSFWFFLGLRKVYPYYFTFTTFTKGRWVGEKILDVFAREFRAHPAEEYERCIQAGTLTVNYDKVPTDYKLKHNDLLANIVHRYV